MFPFCLIEQHGWLWSLWVSTPDEFGSNISYERRKAGPLDDWNSICHSRELSVSGGCVVTSKRRLQRSPAVVENRTSLWSVLMDISPLPSNFMGHNTIVATNDLPAILSATQPAQYNHLIRAFVSHTSNIFSSCWELIAGWDRIRKQSFNNENYPTGKMHLMPFILRS